MKPLQINWRIVLVRPRNPLNIGAAARALANFGIVDMAVVAPFEPTWHEARTSAIGGETVIASARAVPTLLEATSDATLVLGTTTGSRRNLGREILPLPDLPAWLRRRKARGRAALVFGSEKTGLSNDDMTLCHALVRIPTAPDCPSMNLGQAVAVCAYELTRAGIVAVAPADVVAHRSERRATTCASWAECCRRWDGNWGPTRVQRTGQMGRRRPQIDSSVPVSDPDGNVSG